jgi:hypothetical protein
MSVKVKVGGAALLASMAVAVSAAASVSATTGGHFVSEVGHTSVSAVGDEASSNFVAGGTKYGCLKTEYPATATSGTVTEVVVSPVIEGCTSKEAGSSLVIDLNGCNVRVKIGKLASEENTVELNCPSEKQVELTASNCTMKVPPQSVGGGVAYTTTTANEKHALTVDVSVNFTAHRESGVCVFLGTKTSASLAEPVTVRGLDTEGVPKSITATGTEG